MINVSRLTNMFAQQTKISPQLSAVLHDGSRTPVDNSMPIPAADIHPLLFRIVDNSSNAVVITDANKNILYVNRKFEQISGYSLNEVMGENPRVLKSHRTPAGTYRDMNRTLSAVKVWKGIFINIHKQGHEYVEEATITPVCNAEGIVSYYIAEKKDITAQKAAEQSIERLTHFDSLTELPNRACFIERASWLTNQHTDHEHTFSILFADLNRFKELNDTRGHLAGDSALKQVARRFERCLAPDDLLARIGGDEFVIIHRRSSNNSTAALAEKIIGSLTHPIEIEGQDSYLGVSIGSAEWPRDGNILSDLLAHADLAMYQAKSKGAHYIPYDTNIGSNYQREFSLSNKLGDAIKNNRLFLVYQPKVDLSSGRICGLEALMRWSDPEMGMISPAEFIPIAEKQNQMNKLGSWLITQACQQFKLWQSQGLTLTGRMAINISIAQLEHPDFYHTLVSTVEHAGLSPQMFELEVTESILMSDPDRAMEILTELDKQGFAITIDDFGTGYSSMSYLKKLNASVLKIDKSFIDNLTSDKGDQAIVKSIIELSHNFGMSVVAEGVETDAQLNALQALNCDMVQGYYFFKPISADEINALL